MSQLFFNKHKKTAGIVSIFHPEDKTWKTIFSPFLRWMNSQVYDCYRHTIAFNPDYVQFILLIVTIKPVGVTDAHETSIGN